MNLEGYDGLKLENQLCFPLYVCAKEVVRQYRKPLEELNLTYTQYIVMMVLWEFGGMTEGELGKKVHLDSGTLTPLLKRLEKQGLLKRIRPEDNERKLFLKLTPEGEALLRLSDAEALAVRYREHFEYVADILLHAPLDEQMRVFRERKEHSCNS